MSIINWARHSLVAASLIVAAGAGIALQTTAAQAAAPHSAPAATSASSSPLNPGPAPTTFPASARKSLLGSVRSSTGVSYTVYITKAGRYTVEFDNLLPTVISTEVDGVTLKPTSLDYYDKQWSQTFTLNTGTHVLNFAASSTEAAIDAYLFGTL